MVNERINKLRDKTVCDPEICTDKAYWYTASHKETVGEAHQIRRAKAMAKVMENTTVIIDEGELLVGRLTSKVRGGILNPEANIHWLMDELDTIHTRDWDKYAPISEADKQKIRDIEAYWKDKSLFSQYVNRLPKETAERDHIVHESGAFCGVGFHIGHLVVDYKKVLELGLEGIISEIKSKISELDVAYPAEAHKLDNYNAWSINLQGIISFAKRYSELAKSMAANEDDVKRKEELLKISEVCEQVPAKPARNFWEAMQSIWFIYAGVMLEGCSTGMSFGRVDQYLYPYYKKDIDSGVMNRDQIQELCALFNVRINGTSIPLANYVAQAFGGHCLACDFTLGGVDENGNDAVNELTYVFLDAQLDTRTRADDLVIRYNKCNPLKFIMRALEVSIALGGKIKWVGDEAIIQTLMKDGKTLEMARNYCIEGCFQPSVGGISVDVPGGPMNIPLFMELALNRGISRVTGRQIGIDTGNPLEFKTYEDLWNAFKAQLVYCAPHSNILKTTDWRLRTECCYETAASGLYKGCMETGLDIIEGGTAPYLTHATLIGGAPTAGNSLAALKKVVFEDKQLKLDQVLEALENDFDGYPDILNILTKAPKFGNDDNYVDSIVNEVIKLASDNITKYPGVGPVKSTAAAATVTNNVPLGAMVGATPDGRRARTPISEGGISPYQGTNISGLTSTFNSVAKLDHGKLTGGTVLNVKISPALIQDDIGRKRMSGIIKSYFDMGGILAQFNIVSSDTLKDAQKNPEQYKDLLVRVSTYSAYFTELSPALQNDIIARAEVENL